MGRLNQMPKWSQAFSTYKGDNVSIYSAIKDRLGSDPRVGLLWCCKSCYFSDKGFQLLTRRESSDGKVAHFSKWPDRYEEGKFYGCSNAKLSHTRRETFDYSFFYVLMADFLYKSVENNEHGMKKITKSEDDLRFDFFIEFKEDFPLDSLTLLILDENKRRAKKFNQSHRVGTPSFILDFDEYENSLRNPRVILKISEYTREQIEDFKRIGLEIFLGHLEYWVEQVKSAQEEGFILSIEQKIAKREEEERVKKEYEKRKSLIISENNETIALIRDCLNKGAIDREIVVEEYQTGIRANYSKFMSSTKLNFQGLTVEGFYIGFGSNYSQNDESVVNFFEQVDQLRTINTLEKPSEKYSLAIFSQIVESNISVFDFYNHYELDTSGYGESPFSGYLQHQYKRYFRGFFLHLEASFFKAGFLREYNKKVTVLEEERRIKTDAWPKNLPKERWKWKYGQEMAVEKIEIAVNKINTEIRSIYPNMVSAKINNLGEFRNLSNREKSLISNTVGKKWHGKWYIYDFNDIFQELTINPFHRSHTTRQLAHMLELKTGEKSPEDRKSVIRKLLDFASNNRVRF